ncbi:MAG: hypothetical protein AAGB48_05970 [Planctomycetota bacterium]
MTTTDTPPAAEDRGRSPYSAREKIARVLWAAVQGTLFRYSFHNWYRWRRFLLTRFGARLHPVVRIRRTVSVECPWNLAMGRESSAGDGVILYCLGPVCIGDRVSISQHAHICAGSHDHTRPDLPLTRPPITIEDDAWIATDAFVGPGTTVGRGAILGARGCAFKDLASWTIYGGNPAKPIRTREPFDSDQQQAPTAP